MSKITPEMTEVLKKCGSNDGNIATAALGEIAKAFVVPLRQGVLRGDIVEKIYQPIDFTKNPGTSIEFPVDLLSPGSEKEFIAFTIPNTGRIPERHVEGDYVMVRTYDVGASIDCAMKYLRDGRWDIMGRMLQVIEAMFVRKANTDGFHTLLAAAAGRGLTINDTLASDGLFTKRLLVLLRDTMRRQAGGNSASINRGKLTDVYMSVEALSDMASWDLTQVDDQTRNRIYNSPDGTIKSIFNIDLHDLDELGVGQEFETYIEQSLSTSLPGSKTEFLLGLDLMNRDSFAHPVRADIEIFEDMNFHRSRRVGLYGTAEHGWAVLDSRRVILGAL